eukprot:9542357-Lingulodinium_polyedra.AAC.1
MHSYVRDVRGCIRRCSCRGSRLGRRWALRAGRQVGIGPVPMFAWPAASSVAPRGESMQARPCNPVADLIQPADGASEYNIAPAHGGIAFL